MADQRENILNRLVPVCLSVTGINASVRNRRDVPGIVRPAAIILDGAEAKRETEKRVHFSERQMMEMKPEIRIIARSDDGVDAGALMSVLRGRLVAAILTDPDLRNYVGTNGDIQFEEFAVDEPDPDGREFRATLGMTFTYPFHLSDFA